MSTPPRIITHQGHTFILHTQLEKMTARTAGYSCAWKSALGAFICATAGQIATSSGLHPAWLCIATIGALALLIASFLFVKAIDAIHAEIDAREISENEGQSEGEA